MLRYTTFFVWGVDQYVTPFKYFENVVIILNVVTQCGRWRIYASVMKITTRLGNGLSPGRLQAKIQINGFTKMYVKMSPVILFPFQCVKIPLVGFCWNRNNGSSTSAGRCCGGFGRQPMHPLVDIQTGSKWTATVLSAISDIRTSMCDIHWFPLWCVITLNKIVWILHGIYWAYYDTVASMSFLEHLLLTWFIYNPSMDK